MQMADFRASGAIVIITKASAYAIETSSACSRGGARSPTGLRTVFFLDGSAKSTRDKHITALKKAVKE
jgi:hypothetical protein